MFVATLIEGEGLQPKAEPRPVVKTGIMVGLGEEPDEIEAVVRYIREVLN